ncbi:MAG: MBL fold metallo-hydrolase [Candidatus Aureabacteria bacterium]|nr:MBL fold metallo-hydrolase [Candidatus Auribacterota bacterium]
MKSNLEEIITIPVGPLQTNCYVILTSGGESVVIDPGFEAEKILKACGKTEMTHILLTHGHFDHVGAVDDLRQKAGCKVVLHEKELLLYKKACSIAAVFGLEGKELSPPDILIKEEEMPVSLPFEVKVFHTPGHSKGGVSFLIGDILFSGDTLFAGSIGRTDLPEGSWQDMQKSLHKLMSLDDSLLVYPGHGPATNLEIEKRTNPFLLELK